MKPITRILFILLFISFMIISSDTYQAVAQESDEKPDYVELPPLKAENIYCIGFDTYSSSLDPALSYSSNEITIIGTIYEPPLTYHPLKRPYQLIPRVAETMPKFTYRWKQTGKDLSKNEVKRLLNETKPAFHEIDLKKIEIFMDIKIKKGIYFAPHPCFAKDENGEYKYYNINEIQANEFCGDLFLLKTTNSDTRELIAEDFVYQIKRLFNPARLSPIAKIFFNYFPGSFEFYQEINKEYKQKLQALKNIPEDELWLYPFKFDYDKYDFKGVEVIDKYTYRINFKKPYAKFLHWLVMPFFAPMPIEAEEFFYQHILRQYYYHLDNFTVGTGAYYQRVSNEGRNEMWKNPIYREDFYPKVGEKTDKINGLLDDAGKKLPFIDKIIRLKVNSAEQYWEEFLKGRFLVSGIGADKFDKVVKFVNGKPTITKAYKDRGIRLSTSTQTSIWYFAFNMQDSVWGGLGEKKCKLRQAAAIALNMEEFDKTFNNGRNLISHSLIPPGIYGYEKPDEITYIDKIADIEYCFNEIINKNEQKRIKISELTENEKKYLTEKYSIFFYEYQNLDENHTKLADEQLNRKPEKNEVIAEVRFGLNWSIYTWDKAKNMEVRRELIYAKKLMQQAGYTDGNNAQGNALTLDSLTMGINTEYVKISDWRKKKLLEIGIDMKVTAVDYNKFNELARDGKFQQLEWGWNADYPDAENFLFLLMGKNHRCQIKSGEYAGDGGGENSANYTNSEFDALFLQMRNMSDMPKRLRIIRKMVNILRRDVPWILSYLSRSYVLFHSWYKNTKTNLMGNDSMQYRKIDVDAWADYLAMYSDVKKPIKPKADE